MKYHANLIARMEKDAQAMLGALDTDRPIASSSSDGSKLGWCPPVGERYEVESKVAEGGLGAIEAVTDRRLMRTVARKRVRNGAPPRLAREIRILSRLQHSNILPLYEAIVTDGGRADSYTMPLLTGESLRDHAKRFHAQRPSGGSVRLALAPLLTSFGDVCRAIGYAHSRGVWHLDLKGSNVLVDASGAAVVIDWNMALTEDEFPDANMAPGTPGFQAPEQACRSTVGPATDIHGLGALLYELLTGRVPYGGEDRDARTARACSGPPDPPSHYWPAVPRALEAICLKAMSADPRERFQNSEELWMEVDRWRNDETVNCCREPSTARLFRWSRRHPRWCGVLLTLLLATLPILIGWLAHVDRERRITAAALDEARANFAEVLRAGERYFATMSNHRLLQGDGLQPLQQELLTNGLAFYEEFLERRGDAPELRREIAIGWAKLAWLRARTESRGRAAPAARQALELLENHLAENPTDEPLILWKAQTLIVLAEALHDDGQPDAAWAVLDRLDALLQGFTPQREMSAEVEFVSARALFARASVVADRDPVAALPMLRAARAAYGQIAANHPSEENRLRLASTLTKEGAISSELGQFDEARKLLFSADLILRQLMDRPDPLPTTRRGMSTVQHLLGLVELEARDYSAAQQHLLHAYEERHALAVANPATNSYLSCEASTALALARLHRSTGPVDHADEWQLRAHRLLMQCIDDKHPNAHLWTSAMETHCRAGWLLLAQGRLAESHAAFQVALELAIRTGRSAQGRVPGPWGTVAALGLVICETAHGNFEAARTSAVRTFERLLTAYAGPPSAARLSDRDPGTSAVEAHPPIPVGLEYPRSLPLPEPVHP